MMIERETVLITKNKSNMYGVCSQAIPSHDCQLMFRLKYKKIEKETNRDESETDISNFQLW